jgi:hypothetical protein
MRGNSNSHACCHAKTLHGLYDFVLYNSTLGRNSAIFILQVRRLKQNRIDNLFKDSVVINGTAESRDHSVNHSPKLPFKETQVIFSFFFTNNSFIQNFSAFSPQVLIVGIGTNSRNN